MRSSTGQAIVEQLATVAMVATFASGLALVVARTSLPATVANAVAGGKADRPAVPAELAPLVSQALEGDSAGPTVDDVVALVASSVGEEAARREIGSLAYARTAPIALAADYRGVRIEPRGTGSASIVTAAEELRRTSAEIATRRSRQQRQLLALAGEVVASVVSESYLVAIAATLAGRILAGPAPAIGAALPPGMEAGDVVICLPVLWRSTIRPARFNRPPARPGEQLRADEQPLRTYRATLVAIVRAGRTLTTAAFSGEGCRGS